MDRPPPNQHYTSQDREPVPLSCKHHNSSRRYLHNHNRHILSRDRARLVPHGWHYGYHFCVEALLVGDTWTTSSVALVWQRDTSTRQSTNRTNILSTTLPFESYQR